MSGSLIESLRYFYLYFSYTSNFYSGAGISFISLSLFSFVNKAALFSDNFFLDISRLKRSESTFYLSFLSQLRQTQGFLDSTASSD